MRKRGGWGRRGNAAESIIYHDDGNGSEARGNKKAVYAVDKERNSTVKAGKEILCLFVEHIYASVYGRVME